MFPIIWSTSTPYTYLTFDDGPDAAVTPKILDLLRHLQIRATFFVIGEKARQNPGIIASIVDDGHTLGNHSYSHASLLGKSKRRIRDEIRETDDAIRAITGWSPALFRPPYGRFGPALLLTLRTTGHRMVLWNASVHDYKRSADAQAIAQALKRVRAGQIVLLHDGHSNSHNTVAALEATVDGLLQSGVTFAALPTFQRSRVT